MSLRHLLITDMPSASKTAQPSTEVERSLRFWKRIRRVLQVALVLFVIVIVGLLAIDRGAGPAPVLPETEEQFSLTLSVIGAAPTDVVYAVEQRARPFYRIFEFDPTTGEDRTIFTVPEDAIIYGLALSPDRASLAVAYSPNFEIEGSGLWTLDIATESFVEVMPAEPNLYITELEWASDGASVLATHVDRTGNEERLAIAEIDLADGVSSIVVENAITPAVSADSLYYLTVDDQKARRSIGVSDSTLTHTELVVGDSTFDLDHLIASTGGDSVHVAVLESQSDTETSLSIGSRAQAHGNHNVRSTWWDIDTSEPQASPSEIEPTIVYDASINPDGAIAYATLEGLSIVTDGKRTDVIASRAIRFVAS